MRNFDEINENTEVQEESTRKKHILTMYDMLDLAKIAVLIAMIIGCCIVLNSVFKSLGEHERYNSKAKISAGIISDKEIINGHNENSAGVGYYNGKVGYNFNNKSYVPTVYRIHISGDFELDGETLQGSNYFDVSEDIYNSYNIGDYFDSKDLTGNSEVNTSR